MVSTFTDCHIFMRSSTTHKKKNYRRVKTRKTVLFTIFVHDFGPLLHPVLPCHLTSPFLFLLPTRYTVCSLTDVHAVRPRLGLHVTGNMSLSLSEFG